MTRDLAGLRELLLLAWRRDRILIPASGIGLIVLAVASAKATLDLYPTDAAASSGATAIFNAPAVVALYGPAPSFTADGLAVFKTLVIGAIVLGILGFVVVRRHTRTEEEAGRLELLGAGVVGRRAPLTAAVILATVAVAAPALVTVPFLVALGMSASGSIALAFAWITTGMAMIGVTAVSAQLTDGARGCAAISLGAFGVGYGLRAIGDTQAAGDPPGSTDWLTWLSPIGWAEKVSPYGDNRFAVVLLGLLTLAAGVTSAYWLLDRRDLGAGMVPSRRGRGAATRFLRSPEALAVRLARGSLAGWTAGFVLLGAILGSVSGSLESMLDDPKLATMLRSIGGDAGTLTDAYFTAAFKEAAVLAAAASIAFMLRARAEEISGAAEIIVTSGKGRLRWLGSHALVALLAPVWLLFVLVAVSAATASGDAAPDFGDLARAGLAILPACWVFTGVAVLCIGARPRWTQFIWGLLVAAFVLAEFGVLLELPDWLIAASPFDHMQQLGGGLSAAPILWLAAIAATAGGIGAAAFVRRDLQP